MSYTPHTSAESSRDGLPYSPYITSCTSRRQIPKPVYPSCDNIPAAIAMENIPEHQSEPADLLTDQLPSTSAEKRSTQRYQNRIRQRLDACKMGLQKLDILRQKHHRLMQEMRSQLGLPGEDLKDSCAEEFACVGEEGQDICLPPIMPAHIAKLRLPSPTPSSSVSHRSSLSMDSGCLSLTSDRSGGSGLHAENKCMRSMSAVNDPGVCSEDEGCFTDGRPLLDSVIRSAIAPSSPGSPMRRRLCVSERPKSTQNLANCGSANAANYPNENTVVVMPTRGSPRPIRPRIVRSESVQISRAPTESLKRSPTFSPNGPIFRASCVFIDPETSPGPPPRPFAMRRPQSVAWDRPVDQETRKETTWDDVKRMLDPLFENRRQLTPKVLRKNLPKSDANVVGFTVVKAACSPNVSSSSVFIGGAASKSPSPPQPLRTTIPHLTLSRSVSSQSSDSSTPKRREKEWHESEQL